MVARTKTRKHFRRFSILQCLSHGTLIFRACYMASVGYGGADFVVNRDGET